MTHDRTKREAGDDAAARAVPSAADSWRRNVEILELVNRIRATRTQRASAPKPADRGRAAAPRPR
jgi:hypothetical protein